VYLGGCQPTILRSLVGSDSTATPLTGRSHTMLCTILIILAIVALVLFVMGRVRGGRSGL
jgi:hypothetical protein